MKNRKIFLRPLLITLGILFIPFLGNIYVEGWNWPWTAFAFFGIILFSAGLAYEIWGKYSKKGVFGGFIFGLIVACCVIAGLRVMNPNDDVAGVVIISFLIFGILFAVIGYLIQTYLVKK